MFLSDCLLRISQSYGARTLFADKVRKISTVIVEPAILIRTEMISSFDSFTFKKAKVGPREKRKQDSMVSYWLMLEVSHSKRRKILGSKLTNRKIGQFSVRSAHPFLF